jgi:uncharacterized protein YbjT (DUF2867 family)
MNILITGANGYIGQRLVESFLGKGHRLICCVRDRGRFALAQDHPDIEVLEIDFANPGTVELPRQIDVAYYLIHSMTATTKFEKKDLSCAENFNRLVEATDLKQVIYLGGIVNGEQLSKHLQSRLHVEQILRAGKKPITVLRAGIVVGSGSASFEIIRDLVEKLPVMVTPRWLNTLCQPIGIRNVIQYLSGVVGMKETYNLDFDIGGPEVLTYKQMLLQYAEVRGLKRYILTLPVMTPRLSSYWLYFVTSTSYPLAITLVDSMKVNVVCRKNDLAKTLGIQLLTYREAISVAFQRIEQNMVISSWKDAFNGSQLALDPKKYITMPTFGAYKDSKVREIAGDVEGVKNRLWRIGGSTGWYYGNTLWRLRGWMDRMVGGVGLRRGRTHRDIVNPGDALDFWRVLAADREAGRLLLYAEMKLPGEAWLEFKIGKKDGKNFISQVATFRPRGLWGRLYWYSVLPFHYFIFNGMIDQLIKDKAEIVG